MVSPETKETLENLGKVVFTATLLIGVILYSIGPVLNRFFFVPSLHYKQKIIKVIKSNKATKRLSKKRLGVKLGAYRRRILFGAKNPSAYSTNDTDYNFIRLQDEDIKDEATYNEFFGEMSARRVDDDDRKLIFGFFHPYCNAGGGGERVLWQAVYQTLKLSSRHIAVIYTADTKDATPEEIIANVSKRFNLKLQTSRVVFIYLNNRRFVDGNYWKRFTLLGQALGSIILSLEACLALPPDVWVDTMGYPFAYPIISYLLKIPILSYTHFPVIQSDMLHKLVVQLRGSSGTVSKLKIIGKWIYWRIFITVYSLVGYFIDVPLCNGTWTYNHLNKIWWAINGESKNEHQVRMKILYPPCSTETLVDGQDKEIENEDGVLCLSEDDESSERQDIFLCLAQFRPEKRHSIIIKEFSKFIKSYKGDGEPKLVLIGSIRDDRDREFVQTLRALASSLGLDEHVEFILDAPFETVKEYFQKSSFGINAMWNEHFGIAVVETMASGLIPISHASAGPYLDIAVPWDYKKSCQLKISETNDSNRTGFFFKSSEDPDFETQGEFKELHQCFSEAMGLSNEEAMGMRTRGKACVLNKFSNAKFDGQWSEYVEVLKNYDVYYRERKGKVEQLY
ncbi:alpha-1,2-mannosyltransferase [Saccharomycopsis crataegensis]|uniref:GDP-Man:Man(3)GlcNAc(2)-PP-Dol alpha-1,2-mannosyltransferase n=1 Tax=Saccharomycopsis crataegensis TaxID=43959 RepID=A0AAV5QK00_9ASCO|nr:alpha-1,2-mannosyltransferase [Saccharomycopsis crataegensis]